MNNRGSSEKKGIITTKRNRGRTRKKRREMKRKTQKSKKSMSDRNRGMHQ